MAVLWWPRRKQACSHTYTRLSGFFLWWFGLRERYVKVCGVTSPQARNPSLVSKDKLLPLKTGYPQPGLYWKWSLACINLQKSMARHCLWVLFGPGHSRSYLTERILCAAVGAWLSELFSPQVNEPGWCLPVSLVQFSVCTSVWSVSKL